ncbi:IS200/IS605 family transposase [Haloarcula halophila]|uniref:IS200/IS605 family transposase n=1 Tax=Haloarcula TaxID=2237 RepID=UPI0023E3BFA5|nr:IS200/IS605 family transposase [Halomicroarcula sp. DFY41]
MGEYRSHAHSISLCKYHFVWCPKYRHGMLELVRDELAELFRGTAERIGHEIVSMEIATDHVHLFVEADPKWGPAEIAKQFKGYSGRMILKRHPELKQRYFWGSGLWKDGYYVRTTGAVSEDVVRRYIEETEH